MKVEQAVPYSPTAHLRVMQITDSLHAAGRQRVAVNLANLLKNHGYRSYLCTTRSDGPLESQVEENVGRLRLTRTRQFDVTALSRIVAFIREQQIQILHAHGASLFIAGVASLFPPYPLVVWHDHYGRYGQEERPTWLYRLGATRVRAVITVSEALAEWARSCLHVPAQRVWYLPNCIRDHGEDTKEVSGLPGVSGFRIICVANFRPQKDHVTLLRAMALLVRRTPKAHLLLVGDSRDRSQFVRIQKEIVQQKLHPHVSLLGVRRDVPAILNACDVGVLSSISEGFPLTLLEYGRAGLPVVATSVGQCAEILDNGKAGLLVPPRSPVRLADALTRLLQGSTRGAVFGEQLQRRAKCLYASAQVIEQVCHIYGVLLKRSNGQG